MKTEKTYNADEPIVEQETYKLPAGVVFGLSTARGELVKLHGVQILEGKAPLMDKKTQNELCRLVGDFVNDLYKLKRENELAEGAASGALRGARTPAYPRQQGHGTDEGRHEGAALMAQRGDSKAINLTKPTEDTRRKMQCPHPFCFEEIFGHRRDLMIHYQDKHKCGRCNKDKHHKCKKDLCGCGCRWGDPQQESYDVATLNKLMGMAFQRGKIDGEKLNAQVREALKKELNKQET